VKLQPCEAIFAYQFYSFSIAVYCSSAERLSDLSRENCRCPALCRGRDYILALTDLMGRDSSVGIATGYGLDDRGVGVGVSVGSRIFTSPFRPDRLWGPSSLLSKGYRVPFPEVKRPEREIDHSPPTSGEVKETWVYTSTLLYAFMA
jgi:hypothetical protein